MAKRQQQMTVDVRERKSEANNENEQHHSICTNQESQRAGTRYDRLGALCGFTLNSAAIEIWSDG